MMSCASSNNLWCHVEQIAMAARDSSDVSHDDITTDDITNDITDDITTDQDLFWAAVKEEVECKPSSQPAYTAVSVKVEPVDSDEVLTSDDGQTGKADTLLPPIEEVNVDPPPVKTEPNQEDSWGHLELDELSQLDPLLLPADVKQEAKKELPSPGSFLTSSYIKEEPDRDGAGQWQLESESYESDYLTSINLLLPGKQEEEEGRVNLPCIAAGKEEVAEEKSCAKPFVCDICKEEFEKKSPLRRHILMHSDSKRQSTNLRCHTKTHTGDKPHACSVCSKCFTRTAHLKRHMFNHTGEKPHACSVCSKRFTQSSHLKRHMFNHTGEKPHACSVCSKRFSQSSTLKLHMFNHTGEKPHACSVCSKRFTKSSYLEQHMFNHTGEKPHACSVCSKCFTESGNLKQHMLTHTGEKPHACSVCSKRFSQSSTLKLHSLIHTGEKPHVCSVCSKRFALCCHLKQHMLTHTGEKLHACSVCSKRFTRSSHLKRHMVSHTRTTNKDFTCSVCSRIFALDKTLKRHMQAQHPDQ